MAERLHAREDGIVIRWRHRSVVLQPVENGVIGRVQEHFEAVKLVFVQRFEPGGGEGAEDQVDLLEAAPLRAKAQALSPDGDFLGPVLGHLGRDIACARAECQPRFRFALFGFVS